MNNRYDKEAQTWLNRHHHWEDMRRDEFWPTMWMFLAVGVFIVTCVMTVQGAADFASGVEHVSWVRQLIDWVRGTEWRA